MEKTKNDQERAKYTRLISEKEDAVEELKADKRKLEDSLQNLQADLQRGYRNLSMLNEEDSRDGNQENLRIQRQAEEQEQFVKRELMQVEEQMSESYKLQKKFLTMKKKNCMKKGVQFLGINLYKFRFGTINECLESKYS